MSGIDFVDTIVVRRTTDKGTKIIEGPVKPSIWMGKDFKKREEERIKLAGDLMIMSARGTRKIRLSEMRKTKVPEVKGHFILTGKGTRKIKL